MKTIKNSAYDISTWQQVSSKIKNADEDRRSENKVFVDKVNYIISKKGPLEKVKKK